MTTLVNFDRIAESSVNPGSGDIPLSGAIDATHGALSSRFTNGQVGQFSIFGGSQWMTFLGTYNSVANTLTRTAVIDGSSGLTTNVSFAGGTYTVICSPLASQTGGGGLSLISTQTANNTSQYMSWTGLSGFNRYMLVLDSLQSSGAGGGNLIVQFGESTGPTWETSNYYDTVYTAFSFSGSYNDSNKICQTGQSYFRIGYPNSEQSGTTGNGASAVANISGMNAGSYPILTSQGITPASIASGNAPGFAIFNGIYQGDTNLITAIRVGSSAAANLTYGTASLYGVTQ